MPRIEEAASEFLARKRVAVTGVSRKPKGHGSNVVYQSESGSERVAGASACRAAFSEGTPEG